MYLKCPTAIWTRLALLAMKPGEDPYDLTRRRDIWLQSHAMKMAEMMLMEEYDRAANAEVPGEQAGWTAWRNGVEHVVGAKLLIEICERLSLSHARCYVVLGGFFESVPHEAQWLIEERMVVSQHATDTLKDLREGREGGGIPSAGGRFETAAGLVLVECSGAG